MTLILLVKNETMNMSKFIYLAAVINSAIDSGDYDEITIDEVKDEIRKRNILQYLASRVGGFDLSIFNEHDHEVVFDDWMDYVDTINESRKLGVRNKGLSLVMAYIIESIGIHEGDRPNLRLV